MQISRDELEALKRALLEAQDAVKLAFKTPRFRGAGGVAMWNRACSTIDSIVRNVESTDCLDSYGPLIEVRH